MSKKIFLFLIFSFIFLSQLFSVNNKACSFLREGIGAKEVAIGGANTASSEGVNSIYWNPAGLISLDAFSFKIGSFYSLETQDRHYAFLGFAFRSDEYGSFGTGIINYGISNIELYDENGFQNGNSSDSEYIFALSYANKINYQIKYGLTVKGHYHDLVGYKGLGYSLDLGFIFQPLLDKEIYFGIMLNNLFGEFFWNEIKEDILTFYKFGASVMLFGDILRFNFDIVKEENLNDIIFKGGVEFKIIQYFFIRGGIEEKYPTLGVGVKYEQYQIDYAYIHNKYDLGDLHQISLILMW